MKKNGILNRDIASLLAKLGHTDRIAIADCGLPIPDHVPCIDLSIRQGTPSFLEVLSEVLDDMAVERLYIAKEMQIHNPKVQQEMNKFDVLVNYYSHEDFKKELHHVKAIIRTGENTPYANVILQSGVIF
ncbi:D-ribose pyranase [Alteribacter populi]|uniref:D-ribose pyranase n=1 Tax=Alteribacter populi TaxID=2011011 RepID=UPI000BBA93DE|nr:D-ribose pyranase [Alteribacter populi]